MPEDRPEDTVGPDEERRVPPRRGTEESRGPDDSDGGARPEAEDFPEQDAPQALLNRLRSASEARGTPRGPAPKQQGKTSRRRYSP